MCDILDGWKLDIIILSDQSICGQLCLKFLQTVQSINLKPDNPLSTRSTWLTLTGKNSIFSVSYFLTIDLIDDLIDFVDYELNLTDFKTYHMIPNVNFLNNEFYFDNDKEITILEKSYE